MVHYVLTLLLGLAALTNAHFQLQYPPPRGPFVENSEPTFCDGYDTAVSNRSIFPLNGGFFSLNSEHSQWTLGVLVSTAENPTSFNNFSQVVPFFKDSGEGLACIPIDLIAHTNGSSLQNGQNITLQFVFDGGDGELYQCADLTLSSNFQIPSNVTCTNATSTTSSSSSTSTGASSPTKSSAAMGNTFSAGVGLALGTLGIQILMLL